jgi:hypothetical protein
LPLEDGQIDLKASLAPFDATAALLGQECHQPASRFRCAWRWTVCNLDDQCRVRGTNVVVRERLLQKWIVVLIFIRLMLLWSVATSIESPLRALEPRLGQ